MKVRNMVQKFGRKAAVVGGLMVATTGVALADAAAAAAKVTAVEGDVGTLGWAAIGVLVVAAGFKYMRRAV
ncbi:major capsid protein [Pseudomonas sp. PS02288]|uniref:major capsid protein n=1 Tax=Pseudomonas sp. PS02288 TaxID=2991443 RepID=UPI00249AAE2E|nr:major capsid protein [Pseudomonas sp. PS02288]